MRFGWIASTLLLFLPTASYALYNGSPSLPEMPETGFFLPKNSFIAVKLGYEGDYVFGRNLDISSSLSDPGMSSMFNGAALTLGFINRVEIYSALGASKSKVSFKSEGTHIHLKTAQNFGGEIGIRANTPIWGEMKFGIDAKYFYAWPTLDHIEADGVSLATKGRVFQKEWQVGAAISQTFAWFTPYVGAKFARFNMDFVDLSSLHYLIPSSKAEIHNEQPFGFFIGMGISGETGGYLDFEAQFFDDYALTGAVGVSF